MKILYFLTAITLLEPILAERVNTSGSLHLLQYLSDFEGFTNASLTDFENQLNLFSTFVDEPLLERYTKVSMKCVILWTTLQNIKLQSANTINLELISIEFAGLDPLSQYLQALKKLVQIKTLLDKIQMSLIQAYLDLDPQQAPFVMNSLNNRRYGVNPGYTHWFPLFNF